MWRDFARCVSSSTGGRRNLGDGKDIPGREGGSSELVRGSKAD